MKVHELAPDLKIFEGHVLDILRTLPDKSVQCVTTSDPYYGLRSYGKDVWEGGDANCDHPAQNWDGPKQTEAARSGHAARADRLDRDGCTKCGAKRIDTMAVDWPEVTYSPMAGLPPITVPAWRGAYGLEPTPEMYVGHSVLIRRGLWPKMRDDATHFLNLGDFWNGSGGAGGDYGPGGLKEGQPKYPGRKIGTLKAKDLCMIPARVALALQADGWYLRSDIIWGKPNPMPESVTDRPTKAHEYIFLLTKSANYFYDYIAIQEPAVGQNLHDITGGKYSPPGQQPHTGSRVPQSATFKRKNSKRAQVIPGQTKGTRRPDREDTVPTGFRNKRSVWEIATVPFGEAHFATQPPKIPEIAILAGTSPYACQHCQAPWERVMETVKTWQEDAETREQAYLKGSGNRRLRANSGGMSQNQYEERGWQPTCSCVENDGSGKCRVLDIFHGSGTTGEVALRLGRSYWGVELNPEYVQMSIRARLQNTQTTFLGQI